MQATKTVMLESASTPDDVTSALLAVVQDGSYTLVGLSNETREIAFASGKTAISWGHEYLATVQTGDGGSVLTLACGGVGGRPKALLDGWKNKKAAGKVAAALEAALSSGSPIATPRDSFSTGSDGVTGPWTGSPFSQR